MGVPGFFLWLMKNYKKEGFVFNRNKLILNDINNLIKSKRYSVEQIEQATLANENIKSILDDINSMDYFLIDANCLIHPVCFKIIADNPDLVDTDKLENKMIIAVLEYIDKLIDYVDPKKGIYLAIDGVAPVAKIKQQRSRRFKSVADKVLWDNIKKKHKKPTSSSWNNSAITPGTIFMEKLHNRILTWAAGSTRQIIYSSSFTPAEGEHKLLQFIRDNQKESKDYSYVIYGLDADLIFLALSTESDKIYLLREANEINKNESKEVLNYVSIKIMRKSIVSTLIDSINKQLELKKVYLFDSTRMVNDFIFMCYFLGNDFLPHIPSLDIHHNGIENLIQNWAKTMIEMMVDEHMIVYLLGNTYKINSDFLLMFINKLSMQEEGILKENFTKKKRRMHSDGEPYEAEVFKIENLQFKIADPILLGSDSPELWRQRYYKHYWGVELDELEEFSEKLVKHYLTGIKWVTQYYFNKCPSWDWYYPFDQPPFISDIAKYLIESDINKITFKLGTPLKPFMQLLAVLPPQSNYLLPDSLKKLVMDSRSSLAYMYPYEFEQDFINKKKYWMGIPKLPPVDIDLLKHYYSKYKDELKSDEIKRNGIKKPIIIN
jgi:5'-3' exoribonuclease 2